MNTISSGQQLVNGGRGFLQVLVLARMDCLTKKDVKPLICLNDRADFTAGKLKQGMIQGSTELTGADSTQIAAVNGCCAVRMQVGFLDKALWIALHPGMQGTGAAQQ